MQLGTLGQLRSGFRQQAAHPSSFAATESSAAKTPRASIPARLQSAPPGSHDSGSKPGALPDPHQALPAYTNSSPAESRRERQGLFGASAAAIVSRTLRDYPRKLPG